MQRIKGLKCRECGRLYPIEPINVCDYCFGPLEVDYDYAVIRTLVSHERIAQGPRTIWRYRDLLPVNPGREPGTPPGPDAPVHQKRCRQPQLLV